MSVRNVASVLDLFEVVVIVRGIFFLLHFFTYLRRLIKFKCEGTAVLDQINHTRQQSAGTAVDVEDEVDESNLCEAEIVVTILQITNAKK